MKKILFVVALFCGVAAFGQGVGLKPKFAISGMSVEDWLPIPGYTKINFRYEWIAGAFDSGLHVPQYNGVPSGVRSGVWQADGAVAVDTSAGYFYWYNGGTWHKAAKYSDLPTTIPISSLTAATGTNSINNGGFTQNWSWGTITSGALGLYTTSSTTSTNGSYMLQIGRTGTHAASSTTTYGIQLSNGHAGTGSVNVGIHSSASNGDTTIGGRFQGISGTINYAIIVPPSGGSVGIGTSTPDSLLHNAGSLHNAGNGRFDQYIDLADISAPATPASGFGRIYTRTDSLRYKNDAGTEFTLGLGGGGTPGGSDNEVQYNNGGAFGGMTGVEYYGAANMVLRSQAQAAADVAIIGKAHASQSANIFEVQNSSGTSIGYITAAGRFGATDFYGVIGTDIQLGNVLGTGYNVLMAGSTFGVRFRDNAGNLPFQWDFGSGTAPFQKMVAARMLEVQGTDVASIAGAIALTYGNTFEITGTNAITLISNVNWQNGSVIYLLFTSTATLTDGTANSGTDIGMELAGGANFTGSADDVVTLILGEIGGTQRWREVSRSVN